MGVMTRRMCARLQMQQLLDKQEMGKPKSTTRRGSTPGSPQSPGSPGGAGKRRPIRPIDRQKMRPWLLQKLDSGELQEALWWKEDGKRFAVRWPHAARQGFKVEDAKLFKAWARHSGIYREGDEEDHKKWKSNFRCALHSVPDIEEVTCKNERKGQNAARIYELLDQPIEKRSKKDKSGRAFKRFVIKAEEEQSHTGSESDSGVSTSGDNDVYHGPEFPTPKQEPNMPDFTRLGMSTTGMTFVHTKVFSGGMMKEVKKEPPSPTATFLPQNASCSSVSYPTPTSATLDELFRTLQNGSEMTQVDDIEDIEEIDGIEGIEGIEEEMRPVGIVTRQRTPSGDSGLPSSPRDDDIQIMADDDTQIMVDDDTLCMFRDLTEADLQLMGGSQEACMVLSTNPNENMQAVSEGEWQTTGDLLDISASAPQVAVEVVHTNGSEDFNFTGLVEMLSE
ncbi:uncharacterized protein [Littorina saxatilis]|uniref:uncharacterized protein isoform X2 n=1 Tax=Littorina saxatilis TaxID=31220 RepID=UPI0038B6790C